MDILKKEQDIRDHISESIKNDNVELEVIFGYDDLHNPLNKSLFLKLLDNFKNKYNLVYESINLDIRKRFENRPGHTRCSILDIDSIKKYCITNSLNGIDNLKFIKKSLFRNETIKQPIIRNREYNYRLTLKTEDELGYNQKQIEEFNKTLETAEKHFRYKKRYSFETPDKLFRIDLSVVKSTLYHNKKYSWAKSFKSANILNNNEEYELEIEYVGSVDRKDNGVILINDFYNKLMEDIPNPRQLSGSVSNPMSMVVQDVPDETFEPKEILQDKIVDVPSSFKEISFKTRILGKNMRIKDIYFTDNPLNNDIKEIFDKDPELHATVIDYDDDLDGKGKCVLLQINEPNEERTLILEQLDNLFPEYKGIEFNVSDLTTSKRKTYLDLMKKLNTMDKDGIKIWIPLLRVYSDYFDLDKLILEYFGSDESSGGGTTDDKELIFSSEKLETLTDKCIEILNEHLLYSLELINNTKLILSESFKESVLKRFKQITDKDENTLQNYVPQPVTLNYKNLLINNDINIIKGYAVTEKADGTRCLLFITGHSGYLITHKLDVISTGIKFPDIPGEWVLDGEFITKNKDKQDIKLYMIFDIYYNNNTTPNPAFSYPWMIKDKKQISRMNILKNFESLMKNMVISDIENIRIGIKEYKYGAMEISEDKRELYSKLIFEKCKEILDNEKLGGYEYRIDGLILLPTYLGVKGNKLNKSVKNIGGSWEYNFKWKPEKENTIDFKVITEKDGKTKKDKVFLLPDDEGKYKKIGIIVKYDERYDKDLNFCLKLARGDKFTYEKTKQFNPPDISENVGVTNISLTDNKMICEDGSEIKDGDIVEMRYNKDGLNGMIWEPLRVRVDKIVPNAIDTANNVWKTIIEPVTNELMTGEIEYDYEEMIEDVSGDTGYYVSQNRSEQSYILTKLHNYIKTTLINGTCTSFSKRIQYLDLSCGRGGDVDRYVNPDNNIKFVLGLDIEDVNEACRRFFIKHKRPKGIFLQGDTSLNIKNNECDMGNEHTKLMLDILYGDTTIKEYKSFNGLAKHGFDVVSSQFTLHYYLKDKSTFDGFLKNVYQNINKGGYFIATFYNGNKLYEMLEDKEVIEYKSHDEELIYKIEKKIVSEDFTYNKGDTSNMFGNSIDVYMDSIGTTNEEYLVNLDFLVDSCKEHGLELVTPKPDKKYSSIFKKECLLTDGIGSFENVIKHLSSITKSDKIYQEIYKDADNITKDKHLQLLSGLNVYVMFKKV